MLGDRRWDEFARGRLCEVKEEHKRVQGVYRSSACAGAHLDLLELDVLGFVSLAFLYNNLSRGSQNNPIDLWKLIDSSPIISSYMNKMQKHRDLTLLINNT